MKRTAGGVITAVLALLWGGGAASANASDVWGDPMPSPLPEAVAPAVEPRGEQFAIFFNAYRDRSASPIAASFMAATSFEVADFAATSRLAPVAVTEPRVLLLFLSALAVFGASLLRVRRGDPRPKK
jgi:hypothetical protein